MADWRVLFISGELIDSDGAPYLNMAAFQLAKWGRDVIFLGPCSRGKLHDVLQYSDQLGLDLVIHRAKRGFGWHIRFLIRILRRRFSASPRDVFYVQGSTACPGAYLALFGWPSARLIYHTQNYLEPGRHPHWAFFERLLARKAGYVICNEINRARFMCSSYRLRDMPAVVRTALPSWWPIPTFDASVRQKIISQLPAAQRDGCCLILHQGQYSNVRCTRELIQAMTMLPSNYILVFTGVDRESEAFVKGHEFVIDSGVEPRVAYIDRLPFNELLRYTAACDIGVLLYPNDGVGNFYQAPGRLTEYLRAGLPILTSEFPGFELLVIKHRLGCCCNSSSPKSISRGIKEIWEHSDEKMNSRRKRLRELAESTFTYEAGACSIQHIMEGLQNE